MANTAQPQQLAIDEDEAGFEALDAALADDTGASLTAMADSPISDEADKPLLITGREDDDNDLGTKASDEAGPVSTPEDEAKAAFEKEQADLAEASKIADEAAAKAAQETTEKPKEQVESEPERQRRLYLEGLEPKRRLELEIAARFPNMDLDDVKALAAKQISASPAVEQDEPSYADRLKASTDRLAEVQAAIREQDKRFRRVEDDEDPLNYDKLAIERDELLADIPSLRLMAENEESRRESINESFADAEARAIVLVPDLADDTTEMFALVAGRTEQLVSMANSGKALPKISIEGKDVVLDPNDPEFPYLVAYEQHVKAETGKSKAPEAKPGAKEAEKPTPARSIAPAPASSASAAANRAPVEGQENIGQPSLKEQANKVRGFADLDKMLADEGQSWRPRRTQVL